MSPNVYLKVTQEIFQDETLTNEEIENDGEISKIEDLDDDVEIDEA